MPGTSRQSTLTRPAAGFLDFGWANAFLLPARSFARLGALLASPARPSTLSGRGEAALGAAFVAELLSASASRAVPRLTGSAGFGAVALIFAVFAVAVLPAGASCGCRAAVVLIEFRSVAAVGALQSACRSFLLAVLNLCARLSLCFGAGSRSGGLSGASAAPGAVVAVALLHTGNRCGGWRRFATAAPDYACDPRLASCLIVVSAGEATA